MADAETIHIVAESTSLPHSLFYLYLPRYGKSMVNYAEIWKMKKTDNLSCNILVFVI